MKGSMRRARRAAAYAIAGAALLMGDARADAPSASASASAGSSAASSTAPAPGVPPLAVRVQPIFGNEAAVGYGWQDFVVTIENPTPTQQKGTVELRSHLDAYSSDRDGFAAKALFAVPAARSVALRLPMRARTDQVPQLTVRVTDDRGREIASMPVNANMAVQPTLVDIDNPSRLAIPLRGWPATVTYSVTPSFGYYTSPPSTTPPAIAVASPSFDATTGDPVLPTRAAAYSGVTAVLIHSDVLARLEADPKGALFDWVAGGGTLAIVVARPEDLHGPDISELAGVGVVSAAPNPALATIPAVRKPASSGAGAFPTPTGTWGGIRYDADDPSASAAYRFIRSSPTLAPAPAAPNPITTKLVGFSGGRLAPSGYGASADFGRGVVHLLAFDPTESPGVDDAWALSRMVDLINRAWDRRASVVFPAGVNARNASYTYAAGPGSTDDVRRALDPNENFRPALGIAAILLVLYSVLVGPLNFLRAKNRGKPLRPLVYAPLFSAGAFAAIVMVGLGVKGWRGRTRHLALVEAGSGQTRAAITRFRGFYTSQTRSLSITASDRTSVLDVLSSDSVMDDKAVVRVDRDGFSLDNITSLPWQTLVVRENGYVDLKGPVTITTAAGSTEVKNGTGQTMLDVLVYVPGDGVRYFASLKNGDSVTTASGKLLMSAATRRATTAGTMTVHPFDPSTIASMLPGKDGDRLTKTWSPMSTVAGDGVDWFPDDADVVLAEVEGGERVKSDDGLSVESDRMLLRVVKKP